MKDDIFKCDHNYESFVFDARVSDVFDDMVSRSVPGYATIQLLIADLANRFEKGGLIYDLGCSTGNTLLAIMKRAGHKKLKLIGIDNSPEMLKHCKDKIAVSSGHEIILNNLNLLNIKSLPSGEASVIILNLILQFIRPIERKEVVHMLWQNLKPGGCLILVEKTMQKKPLINDLFIDYYHAYKKEMGYSDLEISRKREALENKLIPFYPEENLKLLIEAGFNNVSTFFQWMNFQGFLAIK